MLKVKFCKDCKWSRTDKSSYEVRCVHSSVVANDPWALTRMNTEHYEDRDFGCGKSCHEERSQKWFGKCGIKGKLWETKND